MDVLQQTLERTVRTAGSDLVASLVAGICERKLAVKGVRLSPRERKRLLARLELGNYEDVTIRRWSWWSWKSNPVTVEFDDTDLEAVCLSMDAWIERLPTVIDSATKGSGDRVAATLKRDWRKQKRHCDAEAADFRSGLKVRWGQPLGLLEALIAVAQELGETTNKKLRESLQHASAEPDNDLGPFRIEAITRLHARACQTAAEVLALLGAGFADGAMARWRTLHEIAVVAILLVNGDETLAERYLRHDAIEECRAAVEYQAAHERLGWESLEAEHLETLKRECVLLEERWGKPYGTPYGWAAALLAPKKPNFSELEKRAGVDHLRPLYRLASHNVHANPKGVLYKLGLLDESNLLLAGPSIFGLSEPGANTALSLLIVTECLGRLRPVLDVLVVLEAMLILCDEARRSFATVRAQLDTAYEAARHDRPEARSMMILRSYGFLKQACARWPATALDWLRRPRR